MLQKIFGYQLLKPEQKTKIDQEYKVFREFEHMQLMENGEPAKRKIADLIRLVGKNTLLRAIHRTSDSSFETYEGNADEKVSDLEYYSFMLTKTGEEMTLSDYNDAENEIKLPTLDTVEGNIRFYHTLGKLDTYIQQQLNSLTNLS